VQPQRFAPTRTHPGEDLFDEDEALHRDELGLRRRALRAGMSPDDLADIPAVPMPVPVELQMADRHVADEREQERAQLVCLLVRVGPAGGKESALHNVFCVGLAADTYTAETEKCSILLLKEFAEHLGSRSTGARLRGCVPRRIWCCFIGSGRLLPSFGHPPRV